MVLKQVYTNVFDEVQRHVIESAVQMKASGSALVIIQDGGIVQ